jgi:superfamily I DNA and/or RNA helicase/very-short-patch-repair endonuclease
MMSPASVAQYLIPGEIEFDIVIFDEASQMKPEDAIGSIARGKQLVVVGDPEQLPPTSFFDRIEMSEAEEDEFAEERVESESILDLSLNKFSSPRELRWHYRSRHESLIAFSNYHFYKNALIVFPSPFKQEKKLGVEFHKIEDGFFNKDRVNIPEASVVAQEAVYFMMENAGLPEEQRRSLGIVTINQSQREILDEEITRQIYREPLAQEYIQFWENSLEPFFVKNLENVQGDERDTIFISMVYGKNETGKVLQRFGPINSKSGHRRLNVLFTRAKERVAVFSSMDPADVLPLETSNRGVTILKDYLEYSISGNIEIGQTSERDPDSEFEIFVADALRHHGYKVDYQIGVAGFFIDIGVKDPNNPSNYLCGIECDGATYHSAKSARDRDRLRQESLENLGWKIYRIWSTDWFSNPDSEIEKCIEHLKSLSTPRPL